MSEIGSGINHDSVSSAPGVSSEAPVIPPSETVINNTQAVPSTPEAPKAGGGWLASIRKAINFGKETVARETKAVVNEAQNAPSSLNPMSTESPKTLDRQPQNT